MKQHIIASLESNLGMLGGILSDFTDQDMLARPVAGANHAAWQVGHLILSENGIISAAKPGVLPALPAGLAERFNSEMAKCDDAARFPKKAELLEMFGAQRAGVIAYVKGASEEELGTAMPERMRGFVPTIAAAVLFLPAHVAMHVGQIQVMRRKLNKIHMY